MENKLISFVLPAYKEMYLSKAIESILHQTYPYWELIIVDDASPEPISIMINQYKDKRIKYIRNKTNMKLITYAVMMLCFIKIVLYLRK